MTNQIDKTLGLNPMPVVYEQPKAPVIADDQQAAHDVDQARDGLYEALEHSQKAVQDLALIAQQSQNAKAYEALNSAINTLSAISMNLAELQLKKQKIEGKNDKPSTVNNTLVMTTEELLKLVKKDK